MNKFLRIFLAMFVILFSASIVTECSCGKKAGGGDNGGNTANNNNSGGDSGGDGNGGGGGPAPTPTPEIKIENIDASVAEVKNGTNIELKASGFPSVVGSTDITHTIREINFNLTTNSNMKRAFDLVIAGGPAGAATGGLLLVDTGNKANAGAFSIRKPLSKAFSDYTLAELQEGTVHNLFLPPPFARGTTLDPGHWLELSLFMNPATPTSASPDAPPFAFTQTTGASATRPFMFCAMGVSTITINNSPSNPPTTGQHVQNTTVLTGGQKSSCYVSALGLPFVDVAAENWVNTAAIYTFKKKFNIAAVGIRTDGKTIAEIGLPGTDKATAFHDGISRMEMAELAKANPSAYKKFSVSLVKDAGYSYTTPEIKIENIDASVAQLNGTTIELKASGFPTTVASADLTATFQTLVNNAPTGSVKRAFDVVITGGPAGAATAGLVLVDTGNLANANAFTTDDIGHNFGNYNDAAMREGLINLRPSTVGSANGIAPIGMRIYGVFMNNAAPATTADVDPDASPFALSGITSGGNTTRPFMFCVANVPSITSHLNAGNGILDNNAVFTGGQKASCYVASLGVAFTGAIATAWVNATASNTFKKTFNIAAMGIRTDAKTIASMGMPGTDKSAAFRDGITTTEMTALTAANSSAYKKFSVTIVAGGP